MAAAFPDGDLGLDAGYGALWDAAPAGAFASVNTMSLFGLHRRWRAAAAGHLAAVEMTSSEPSRRYSTGLKRLGFGERTTVFYDEHVEADAVHEQIAAVDMCGSLVAEDPSLRDDVHDLKKQNDKLEDQRNDLKKDVEELKRKNKDKDGRVRLAQ